MSCQLPDELHKSETGPCHDLNALSYLIYNRHGFRLLFVLTAMAVTGLCPITFADIFLIYLFNSDSRSITEKKKTTTKKQNKTAKTAQNDTNSKI